MKTRAMETTDHESVRLLHEQMGLDYRFPDLNSKLVMGAVCEEDGRILGAAILKVQPEAYLWVTGRPVEKWDAIRMLQKELLAMAMKIGFEQVVAYVPSICHFGKRLKMLRWEKPRDGFETWVREVRP